MGGDCLNYGCVPSKALLAAAKHAAECDDRARRSASHCARAAIDFAQVHAHVQRRDRGDRAERFQGALRRPRRARDRRRGALSGRQDRRGRRLRDQGAPLRDRDRLVAGDAADPGPRRRRRISPTRPIFDLEALPGASRRHRRRRGRARARAGVPPPRRAGHGARSRDAARQDDPRMRRGRARSAARAKASSFARGVDGRRASRSGTARSQSSIDDDRGRGDDRRQRSSGRGRPRGPTSTGSTSTRPASDTTAGASWSTRA